MSKPASESCVPEYRLVPPLPGAHQLGQAVERFGVEAQGLAGFACRGASAIGDDIGGHRRAEFAIALIDVLDRSLALVAAGQVKIDVRPLAALFGKKAFEEQIHADRIDRSDAQRIADNTVGSRAAPLHQNAFTPAELHDVPDNKKVAGKSEFRDQGQFAPGLLFGPVAREW